LDQAVIAALLATYDCADLFERAVASARDQAGTNRGKHERELAAVVTEITKAEDAIDRYLSAFEAGTLPESRCGERVRVIGTRIAELRERQLALTDAIEAATIEGPTEADVRQLHQRIQPVSRPGRVRCGKPCCPSWSPRSESRTATQSALVPRTWRDGRGHTRPCKGSCAVRVGTRYSVRFQHIVAAGGRGCLRT
jgi:hypothetical protein